MAKILLADDEEGLRLLLGRQMRRAGHEVTAVEDGLEALHALQTDSFDVVVSDMKMPRLDGMGLLAKALELTPDTEFIILTGHGSMENAVEAFKTGRVFDYLLKPLEDIRELDAVVARALERRGLRSENSRLVIQLQARVDELEETKRQLARLAERDGLTGLLNHRAVHQRLDALLTQDLEPPVSVLLMDMDGFKLINDTYGHPTGDQMLRLLAQTLTDVCGDAAHIGRCGGDEFMVVLPDMEGADAERVAHAVRHRLDENPFLSPDGSRLPIHLCFGVADSRMEGRTSAALIAAADAALYEGKAQGGDQVMLHSALRRSDDDMPTQFDVLDGLVRTIDRKDRYTKRHSDHVTSCALVLADALGMSSETCHAMRVAGLLHDIGKIGIPDFILRKPGRLTPEEYEIMKSHVTLSALIIHGLPRLPEILDAVANHHERWDGAGYPRGLKGEEIPLLGRIMAVADAFSAMTLDRPYRKGLDAEEALAEIERHSGAQFDPELAALFVTAMRANLRESLPMAA